MKRSTKKILTTHVGSLPYEGRDVEWVVRKQRELGLDLVNEGEYTKGGDWLSYMESRFGGFEPRPPAPGAVPLIAQGRDREAFAEFYKYAGEKGTLFYAPGEQIKRVRPIWVCTAPITYTGLDALQKEIRELKARIPADDAFLTSTAPASLEVYRRNEHYKSEEEFVYAIAEAMRVEYEAIHRAGFTLQLDCPDLAFGMMAFADDEERVHRQAAQTVEILNGATANIPPEAMRMHVCWGNYEGPHHRDVPLAMILDIVLGARPAGLVLEAANPRHGHEWALFAERGLPDGKVLVPGLIDSTSNYVEHPELIAQRLRRYIDAVGAERVIAGADCGFGTIAGRPNVVSSIVDAKFAALVEGARLAST
jgi:5-methyltetrahydropteroyltriglutamate--homocysteine methyltransferase